MESLLQNRQLSKEGKELRIRLVRGLLPKMEAGQDAVKYYLKSLSQDELMFLLDFATEELRNALKEPVEDIVGFPVSARFKPIVIPSYLPDGLSNQLEAYYKRVKARHIQLTKNGHSRNIKYVRRRMNDPIRLAVFLNDQGVKMWGSMTTTHLARFFQDNPGMRVEKLHSFINSIKKTKPFTDGRGRGRRGRGRKETTNLFPEVIEPSVLSEMIKERREALNEIEYLAYWLVARMGMVARHAYDFTLEQVTKDDQGKVVIRPKAIWVAVPKGIATLLEKIAKHLESGWPRVIPQDSQKQYLFHHAFRYNQFTQDILQRKSVLLRRSAIFSAMQRGHLDRVTIHQTMGVSMPTIVSLEQLMSVDLHRTMDSKMVKKRNDHILGKTDG